FITANTHSDILFFSTKGKVYRNKMYELPEGKRATKGKFISNFLPLDDGESVTSVVALDKNSKENVDSLIMVTKNGTVKKTEAKTFFEVRASGLIAVNLKDDDELIDARFISKGDSVILNSKNGKAIHFDESNLREMGRTAGGVRGIKLGKGDCVVSLAIVPKEKRDIAKMLVITRNGYGKQTAVKDFKIQNRGGSGIKAVKVTTKTGDLVGAKVVFDEHSEVIAMSGDSQVIRVSLDSVPTLGRDTQGVRIMKLKSSDDAVVTFVRF
ncbi:MAG: DNA gyrase subunit A, partial [Candidatus Pacebacteria bacterium]|nr:DNA gyrase subunit A [Candidatus Paceibacterota bacterium]